MTRHTCWMLHSGHRQRRKERGLTQHQLGRAVGVTFQQMQKYEHGTNRINFSRLAELADASGLSSAEDCRARSALPPSVSSRRCVRIHLRLQRQSKWLPDLQREAARLECRWCVKRVRLRASVLPTPGIPPGSGPRPTPLWLKREP